MPKQWTKRTWVGWSLMTVWAFVIVLYALFAAYGIFAGKLPSMEHHVPSRIAAAAIHFGIGGIALLLGPFQFLPGLRSKRPGLHRWSGRIYVAACLASGIAALVLSIEAMTGVAATAGFGLLAIFWLVTTSMALLKARQRKFSEHRNWMVRSYALTYAAPMLRIYLPLSLFALDFPFEIAYPVISFACWVPNAIFAEWFIRR